jgi:hypothetical protein
MLVRSMAEGVGISTPALGLTFPTGTARATMHHAVVRISGCPGAAGKSYGFLATTLPFSHTYSGVPYIRAVVLASFAARRKARPTPATKDSGRLVFGRFLDFIEAPSPTVVGLSQVLQSEGVTQKITRDIPQLGLPKRA